MNSSLWAAWEGLGTSVFDLGGGMSTCYIKGPAVRLREQWMTGNALWVSLAH